jgi:putative addiction module killer protein
MPAISRTDDFNRWLKRLRDQQGRAIILGRIKRLAAGLGGDVGPVGEGVSELRIHFGPGYRVYFKRLGASIVLLHGGDKSSQQRDIAKAQRLAREVK